MQHLISALSVIQIGWLRVYFWLVSCGFLGVVSWSPVFTQYTVPGTQSCTLHYWIIILIGLIVNTKNWSSNFTRRLFKFFLSANAIENMCKMTQSYTGGWRAYIAQLLATIRQATGSSLRRRQDSLINFGDLNMWRGRLLEATVNIARGISIYGLTEIS